jgi:hypothetical protein
MAIVFLKMSLPPPFFFLQSIIILAGFLLTSMPLAQLLANQTLSGGLKTLSCTHA